MPVAHVKCINTESLEIRLVKLCPAVKRMLVNGDVRWAARKRGDKVQRADVLLVEHQETWAKLLPYFNMDMEKAGYKHHTRWSDAPEAAPSESTNQGEVNMTDAIKATRQPKNGG